MSESAAIGRRMPLAALLIAYGFVLLACLAIRPLWLDEVLQLIATTSPTFGSMMHWIHLSVGAAPLGYFTQRPFVLAGGPVALWARLPSALFSVANCWLLATLCGELKIPRSTTLLAVGLFMLVPLQFRYAMEARPYSEALCFLLVSMISAVKWAILPGFGSAALFLLAMVAAVYTQAYTVFAAFGFCAWITLSAFERRDGWRGAVPLILLFAASLLLVPWYIASTGVWNEAIQNNGFQFHWTLSVAQDIFKAISGGSLLCTVALLIVVGAGAWFGNASKGGPLLFSALVAIVGAVAVDRSRGYFFAMRQVLFAAPGLAILAAIGLEIVFRRRRIVGLAIGGVLLITCVTNDVRMQLNAKENWPAAANALAQVAGDGYCVHMADDEQHDARLYSVFVPSLSSRLCDDLAGETRVALVSNIAMNVQTREVSDEQMRALGFAVTRTLDVGGTTIEMEGRP